MRNLRIVVWLAATQVCLALAGCGDSGPTPTTTPAAQKPAKPTIATISAKEIGTPGDFLPPLDGQRVELAAPKGWVAAARDKKFVAQFTSRSGAAYPRILVTAKDASGSESLTGKNIKAFASKVQDELNQGSVDEDEDAEPPSEAALPAVKPLRIGDQYWVETLRKAHAKKTALERWILVTVVGDRQYTVELRAYIGSLNANRPQVLAVAASLRKAVVAPAGEVTSEKTSKEPE